MRITLTNVSHIFCYMYIAGHLTFQCYNTLKIKPEQEVIVDVSSTSSDSDAEVDVLLRKSGAISKKTGKSLGMLELICTCI